MFINLIETLSRYYYSINKIFNRYLFTEQEIITIDNHKIGLKYYYYLLNYYLNNRIEYIINSIFGYNTKYNHINYYSVKYRDNNMIRMSIINGTIKDVFEYTRYNKGPDKMVIFMRSNIKINNNVINVRQIMRKYDTKTKLYDIIYFHFRDEIDKDIENNKSIEIDIGKNVYNFYELPQYLLLEDA
jgi:hypothetical protein